MHFFNKGIPFKSDMTTSCAKVSGKGHHFGQLPFEIHNSCCMLFVALLKTLIRFCKLLVLFLKLTIGFVSLSHWAFGIGYQLGRPCLFLFTLCMSSNGFFQFPLGLVQLSSHLTLIRSVRKIPISQCRSIGQFKG